MRRVRIWLLVAAIGLGALLLGFRSWYSRLNLAQVPRPPPLNLGDAGQRHLENFRRFHKSIPQAEKEHILDGQFTVVRSTELLPSRLKQAFVVIAGAQRFMMNDPDWTYPEMIDQVFPWRRLVFAGLSDNKWFIHYECGMSQHYYALVIAVLRVDDRGIGKSTGDKTNFTIFDKCDDVRTEVAWLRTQTGIDPNRVMLVGYSEGGLIAPMIAAKDRHAGMPDFNSGPALQ
jgi:hypothetical protein